MVALDSAILQHPRVWEASGHLAGFSDPMVDCRTCKARFRADHLEEQKPDLVCPRKTSKLAGQGPECDLTEARDFNLMFKTQVGAVESSASTAYLRPETAQGIFINFKNVLQFAPARGRRSASRRWASRSATRSPPQLHLPHARVRADGDGVLRAAHRGGRLVRALEAAALRLVRALRHPPGSPAHARARRRRAQPLLQRHRRRGVPLPIGWSELEASPTAATSTSRSMRSSRARSSSTSTARRRSGTCRT